MISPKVTTAWTWSLSPTCLAAATLATMRRALFGDDVEPAFVDRLRVEQRRSDADRHGAGANPVAGVVERHAAGRHQLHLRQRRAHVLDVLRAERRGRKHLDDVGAHLVRVEDLGGREAAGHRRDVALVAGG